MFKRLSFTSLLLILLVAVSPALAQGPINPQHSDPVWQAAYWSNPSLSGDPALTREDANIDFEWGAGSPGSGVPADGFSARWTRYIDVNPDTYRFYVTADDGVRVWIDNQLLLDKWYDHPAQTFTFDKYLGSGHHLIKIEYYENSGFATAQLSWMRKGAAGGEWKGEYFNNLTLSGTPALTRNDDAIDFNWGTESPAPGTVSADHFSVRWTRTLELAEGMYDFTLTTDDGARLWVNGHLLVDAWFEQAATTYTEEIYLPGGDATIELQYYENEGDAVARLSWGDGDEPAPTPGGTVIVDDADSGFVTGGHAGGWRTAYEGYEGRLLWTFNNDVVRSGYNWARWYPDLEARRYEVFVYVPYRYTTTGQARYWVRHAGGYTVKAISQSAHGDSWVSLGTYRFTGTSSDYVSLADVTFEPYRSRLIAFDAVKWVPR